MFCIFFEVEAFQRRCTEEAERLRERKITMPADSTAGVDYCAGTIEAEIVNPGDLWTTAFDADVQQLGVNTLQLPRYPWDVSLWGETGTIDGVSSSFKIPDSIIQPYILRRKALLRGMGPGPFTSVDQMKKLAIDYQPQSMKLYPGLKLDFAYVEFCFEPLLRQKIDNQIRDAMPDGSTCDHEQPEPPQKQRIVYEKKMYDITNTKKTCTKTVQQHHKIMT